MQEELMDLFCDIGHKNYKCYFSYSEFLKQWGWNEQLNVA